MHGKPVSSTSPHDLRRTCAKLCRETGVGLEQIQFLLGQASIQTTRDIWDRGRI
jgi:integrase